LKTRFVFKKIDLENLLNIHTTEYNLPTIMSLLIIFVCVFFFINALMIIWFEWIDYLQIIYIKRKFNVAISLWHQYIFYRETNFQTAAMPSIHENRLSRLNLESVIFISRWFDRKSRPTICGRMNALTASCCSSIYPKYTLS